MNTSEPPARNTPDARHLLVTGLARNCGKTLPQEIASLAGALKGFSTVSWLIIESDSDDDTLEALARLASSYSNFRFLSKGTLRTALPLRTDRLAHCRNCYLDELACNPLYSDVDLVMVADLDGMNGVLTASALQSCWQRQDWDACTANQEGPYYDIWALRHSLWSPNDCWSSYRFLLENHVPREMALLAAVHSRMIRLQASSPWIEVDSAFGGLALYRRSALTGARYAGRDETGEEICEHVMLHRHLRARGRRIFINPALINGGSNAHSSELLLRARAKRILGDLLRPLLMPVIRTLRRKQQS